MLHMNFPDGNLNMTTMKTTLQIIVSLILFGGLTGCDPIEDRLNMGAPIEAENLQLTVAPVVIDGKNTNKVVLQNNSPVLSSWDYGSGISLRQTDTVLLVAPGLNEIIFTGLNPDGSKVNRRIEVNVEEMAFPVPPEWAFLTDGSSKTWVWDTNQPAVWGNGGYQVDTAPAWWAISEPEVDEQAAGEGMDAKMIFSLRGATLTKVYADGKEETGTFSFDMDNPIVQDDGTVWAKGKLITRGVTVLCGQSPNEENAPVYEYDILIIDNEQLVLAYPEPDGSGTGWFWMFRSE